MYLKHVRGNSDDDFGLNLLSSYPDFLPGLTLSVSVSIFRILKFSGLKGWMKTRTKQCDTFVNFKFVTYKDSL